MAVKANRTWQALLVLLPLLVLNMLWRTFINAVGIPSAESNMFSMIFYSFVTGISVLWLLGHKIGGRNRFVTFLFSMAIMAAICLIGAASYGITDPSEEAMICIALTLLLALTVLLSVTMAAMLCARRFTGPRFILWQCLWAIVVAVVLMSQLFAVVSLILSPPDLTLELLAQILVSGVVCGLCVCIIMLPYMILAIRSHLFRERLRSCLQLKSMDPPSPPEAAVKTAEQSTGPESSPSDNSD